MMDILDGVQRTKYCGEFTKEDLGKEVVAMGWVLARRDFGGLVFVELRDRTGRLQVVFDQSKFKDDYAKVDKQRRGGNALLLGERCNVRTRDCGAV